MGPVIVAVDAAVKTGAAGIAVVEVPSGKLLGAEVVTVDNANLAEGLAVIRGLSWLANRGQDKSIVWTDSMVIERLFLGKDSSPRPARLTSTKRQLGELGMHIRAMADRHENTVQCVYRGQVQAAHH